MKHTILTTQNMENISNGIDESPKSHLHPKVGITSNANKVSKQAPIAQNT